MVACLAQWRHSIIECGDTGLPDHVRDIESVSRMVYSVMLDAVPELESRNIAVTAGFRNTKQLLAGMLNLSPTEAGIRVAHAGQLAPRRALAGEVLAPVLPETAAALAAGEIGPAQVRVITETMNAIPASVSAPDRDDAEAELARHARSFNPTSLHKIGLRILAHLDPDGPQPRDERESDPAHSAAFPIIDRTTRRTPTHYRRYPRRAQHAATQCGCPVGGLRVGPRRPGLPHHRRGTTAPDRDHRLGRTAYRPGGRDAGLRHPDQRRGGPPVGMRRQDHPGRSGREIRTTRRRTGHAHRPTIHSSSACRERPRMCVSGLRSAAGNLPGASRSTLDRRWRNQCRELRAFV